MKSKRGIGVMRDKMEALVELASARQARKGGLDIRNVEMGALSRPLFEEATASSMAPSQPAWVQSFEECDNLLRSIETVSRPRDAGEEMALLNNRRLTAVRDKDEAELERRLFDLASLAIQVASRGRG